MVRYARYMNRPALLVYDTAELGAHIRRARHARGLRQEELADCIGVTRMTVSRLERGEPVSVDTALRALSECGYAIAVAPKFTRLAVIDAE
jgi:HTH-type transcriptional regulator / antitoxin HipB